MFSVNKKMVFMDMTAGILGIFSSSAFSIGPLNGISGGHLKQKTGNDASNIKDPSEILTKNSDVKLDKIKEEIKKLAILPSSDEIASKYGITAEQAKQVLAEVCIEVATDAGGTPEEIAQTASNMYLVAEMSDSEIFETFDIEKILKKSLEQQETDDEKDLSAQEIADKYDITIPQAQAVIDGIEKDDEHSASSITASDLSAESTYSVHSGSAGTYIVSTNNSGSLVLSTVSFDT